MYNIMCCLPRQDFRLFTWLTEVFPFLLTNFLRKTALDCYLPLLALRPFWHLPGIWESMLCKRALACDSLKKNHALNKHLPHLPLFPHQKTTQNPIITKNPTRTASDLKKVSHLKPLLIIMFLFYTNAFEDSFILRQKPAHVLKSYR